MTDSSGVKHAHDVTDSPHGRPSDDETHIKRIKIEPDVGVEMIAVDDSENEDDYVQPYEAAANELSEYGLCGPRYSEALKVVQEPIQMLQQEINSASDKPEHIADLCHNLERAANIRLPGAKKIGVMGESGVGKSSLINALLAYAVHAFDCNIGQSGTFVPHEYGAAVPGQVAPCEAEILFFGDRLMNQHLASHFATWYHYRADAEDKNDDDEAQATHMEAESAVQFFRALFCDKEDFSSDELAKKFLRCAKSDSDPEILDRLRGWLQGLLDRAGVEQNRLIVEADDMKTLSTKIQAYARTATANDSADQVPSLWPLVKIIKIRANLTAASLLHSNLTFTDLPGTSDVNQARAKAAAGYVSSCDAIILVAAIDRAISNPWLLQNLRKCFRIGKCILVLTKTDLLSGIVDSQALNPASREQMESYNTALEREKQKRADLKAALREVPRKEKASLRSKISKHNATIRNIEASKKVLGIVARNEYVSNYFKDRYSQQNLEVFCVSNTAYEQHSSGYDQADAPSLSVEHTQIPALRETLSLLPDKARLDALVHHCRNVVPSALNVSRIWCSDFSAKCKDDINVIVRQPEAEITQTIGQFRDDLKLKLDSDVFAPMRSSITEWCQEAVMTTGEWSESYNFSSYWAFIRNEGYRKLKARAGRSTNYRTVSVSWNEELLEPVAMTVVPLFQAFHTALASFEAECCNKLEVIFGDVLEKLREHNALLQFSIAPLINQLRFTAEAERKLIVTSSDRLKQCLRKTSHDAYVDKEGSYLSERMSTLYEELNSMRGPGCHGRRVSRMLDTVSNPDGMFADIFKEIQNHANNAVDEFYDHVSEETQGELVRFKRFFHHFFDRNAIESKEGIVFREKMLGWIDKCEDHLGTQVEPLIEECLQYSETVQSHGTSKRT